MNLSSKSISLANPATDRHPIWASWRIVFLLMSLCFISHFNRISMSIAGDERIMPSYGISPKQMGWIYDAFLIVYTIFMAAGGTYIDRVGVRRALTVMAMGSGFFAVLTGFIGLIAGTPATVFVSLLVVRAVMGFVSTPLHPGSARAVSDWLPEHQRSLANGIVTSAALCGIAFTPPLFGHLMDSVRGWPWAFMIAGAVTIGWGLVWWFSAEPEPAQSDELTANEVQSIDASA